MTATKKDIYLHADCETATLKSHTGKLWQLGVISTLADYSIPQDVPHIFEITRLPHPDNWDKTTLDFATKTYGVEFIMQCINEGLIDYRNIWNDIASHFTAYVELLEANDYVVHLVCNHTDFDVTFLKVMYDKLDRKFPIKYNRIWDMPSLLVAATRMTVSDCYSAIGQSKAQVKHTGLADATAQMNVLRRYNVYLPPSTKE